jgi:hypothetical protein
VSPRIATLALLAIAGLAVAGARARDAGPQGASGAGLEDTAYTVDGGGGRSTGSRYALVGSVGQPDTDPLHPASGGGYSLVGGFLSDSAPSQPGTDPLFVDGFER